MITFSDDALTDAFLILGHLQIGGGITADNAKEWLDAGASKVRQAKCARRQLTPLLDHRHILPLSQRQLRLGASAGNLIPCREGQARCRR
jgi:hypothetical protein